MPSDLIFKARPSKIAEILAEPRSAADKAAGKLGSTVKTYVDQYMKGLFWDRRKRIYGKAITKGNMLEDESIENIGIVHELGFIEKHTGKFDNGWLQGECDIKIDPKKLIIDAKSSWNLSTFPMYTDDIPSKAYEYQVKAYLEGYNMDYGWVCYCLNDSPAYMVKDALNIELWNKKKEDPTRDVLTKEEAMFIIMDMTFTYSGYIEVCRQLDIKRDPNFTEIPLERRVRTFKFERDQELMDKIKTRVAQINNYINTNQKYEQDLIMLRNKKEF